ncbi:MAG: response regulator [candidate division Zixibacteria bacterium]|nr:response regulator [candidate division Zixibacteria bacterium]
MEEETGAYSSKFSILVVDDDDQAADVVRNLLLHEGYHVETAPNGRKAMDLLMSGQHFDLVITDLQMPEMDGIELLRQARQFMAYLPVIAMTGYVSTEDGMQCVEAGAHNYLVKPFGMQSLLKLVKQGLKTSFMNQLGVREMP